jgi:mono/diheme cytochrome c family protein
VNRVPRDPDADFWWITKHGFRMTGMPGWDGILSDDEIWKVVAFIKNSDKLPPDAHAAWQAAAGQASKEGAEKP